MTFFKTIYLGGFLFLLPLIAGAQQPCDTRVGFCNPLTQNSICGALKLFLTALLTLGIPVAVLFLVYAGFRFVWARGNPKALAAARTNLVYVILGLGIFIGAWLLGQIIANTLNSLATGAGQPNPQIGSCK